MPTPVLLHSMLLGLLTLVSPGAGLSHEGDDHAPAEDPSRRTIDLSPLTDVLQALPPHERAEQIRDVLLAAAYTLSDADPVYAQLEFGSRPPLRQPYLTSVGDSPVGPGRIAPLRPGEYLLLLPESEEHEEGFDWVQACRLVDRRTSWDGQPPKAIQIALYRMDAGVGGGEPTASLRVIDPVPGSAFYTEGVYGYAERRIAGRADLERFLADVNDLLMARLDDGTLFLAGRDYPDACYRRPYRRLDLGDLAVLWRAYTDSGPVPASASELGFSLDPWVDSRPLAEDLKQFADDLRIDGAGRPIIEALATRIEEVVEALGDAGPFPAPGPEAPDPSGLFHLIADLAGGAPDGVEQAVGTVLARLAEEHQFQVPRYMGEIEGHDVGMTLFYCDLTAKLLGMGQVRKEGLLGFVGFAPVDGDPEVEGFLPTTRVEVAPFHLDEMERKSRGRLWWGTDLAGFVRHPAKDGKTALRFGPTAVRIFMRAQAGQLAAEEDPPVHWAAFMDSWNRRFLAIADQDPEFHRLNQIFKFAVVMKQLKMPAFLGGEGGASFPGLETAELPDDSHRYERWYAGALDEGRVGVRAPLVFREVEGVDHEALEMVNSGPFTQAGNVWELSGGVTGPTTRELQLRFRSGNLPTGLPGDLTQSQSIARLTESLRLGRVDGRQLQIDPQQGRVELLGERPLPTGSKFDESWEDLRTTTIVGGGEVTITSSFGPVEGASEIGQLTLRDDGTTILPAWRPGPLDQAYASLRRIAANDPIEGVEVRQTATGDRLFVALDGAGRQWLEVRPGGREPANAAPGPEEWLIAAPHDSGIWYRVKFVPDAEVQQLAGMRPVSGPSFTKVSPGLVRLNRSGRSWFPPTEATIAAMDFGDASSLRLLADRTLLLVGPLGEVLTDATPGEIARITNALDGQAMGERVPGASRLRELTIEAGEATVYLLRGDEGWTWTRGEPPPESVWSVPGAMEIARMASISEQLPAGSIRLDEGRLTVPARDPLSAHEAMARLAERPDLVPYVESVAVTAGDLDGLAAKVDRFKASIIVRPVLGNDGVEGLRLADGRILGPDQWRGEFQDRSVLVDVTGLNRGRVPEVLDDLSESLGKVPDLSLAFKLSADAEQKMPRHLIPAPAVIRNDPARIAEVDPDLGQYLVEWLSSRIVPQLGRRGILIRLDEAAAGKTIRELKDQLREGDLAGIHEIIGVCNDDDPSIFFDYADAALTKGQASSVTYPSGTVDPRTMPIVFAHLAAMEAGWLTPHESLIESYRSVHKVLQECLHETPQQTLEALREAFPAGRYSELDVPRLFHGRGNQFDLETFRDVLERMGEEVQRIDEGNPSWRFLTHRPKALDGPSKRLSVLKPDEGRKQAA